MDEKGRKPIGVDENEGEGSKSADRSYRKDVDDFLKHADPGKLGRDAASDIERDSAGYRKAEEEGKRHAAGEDPELYRKGPSSLPDSDVPPDDPEGKR